MRQGKAAPAVLDRSVYRPLYLNGASERKTAFGMDSGCFQTRAGTGEWAVTTQSAAVLKPRDICVSMLLQSVANNLAASGAALKLLQTAVVWPAQGDEKELAETMSQIAAYAGEKGIAVSGGDTTIAGGLGCPVLTLTGIGPVLFSGKETSVTEGMGLVMAGYTGEAGMMALAAVYEQELRAVFPGTLIDRALEAVCTAERMADIAFTLGAAAVHDVSRGGVFGALWEFSKRLKRGFDVQLKELPIRQECIEICEYLDLNPYQLFGQGALLIVTDRAEDLCDEFARQQIAAAFIGTVNAGRGNRIINGEDIRCLEKPAQDMLDVCLERQKREQA